MTDPALRATRDALHAALCAICDPEAVDARAHADQAALVDSLGGREAVMALSMPVGATPPPDTSGSTPRG